MSKTGVELNKGGYTVDNVNNYNFMLRELVGMSNDDDSKILIILLKVCQNMLIQQGLLLVARMIDKTLWRTSEGN